MKQENDYIQDIAEMRSMMERSSKYLSLSGLSAILLGMYALAGAYIAYVHFDFYPIRIIYPTTGSGALPTVVLPVIFLAMLILGLGIGTAFFLSFKTARKRKERFWNPTAKRLFIHMAVPLVTGGLLILVLLTKGFVGLMAPLTLIFYGLAFFNASKFTYEEVRSFGLIQIFLGLISAYFVEYGMLCWALGFGVVHIIYGLYLHFRYER